MPKLDIWSYKRYNCLINNFEIPNIILEKIKSIKSNTTLTDEDNPHKKMAVIGAGIVYVSIMLYNFFVIPIL